MTAGRDAQPSIVLADPLDRRRNEARARIALLTRLVRDELRGLARRPPAERARRRVWIHVAQARRRAWFETLRAMRENKAATRPAVRLKGIETKSRRPLPRPALTSRLASLQLPRPSSYRLRPRP